MNCEIAVICKNKNTLCQLNEMDTIIVFEKGSNGIWQERKVFPFKINQEKNLSELRNEIRNLITKLSDCRIIAGLSIAGLAYNVFDRLGFRIFEIKTIDSDLFDELLADAVNDLPPAPENIVETPTKPQRLSAGSYYLDLIELQINHPEISSKKALQPLLRQADFEKIDVLCSHLPLWLSSPEYKNILLIHQKKYGANILVSLRRKPLQTKDI
jgi:Fe-only nitrogenase accessory protein AnfO